MSGKNPRYRTYRGGSPSGGRSGDDPLAELRDLRRAERGESVSDPRAREQGPSLRDRVSRSRRDEPRQGRQGDRPSLAPRRAFRPSRPLGKRILRWFGIWVVSWIALSAIVFLVSAQVHKADVGAAGEAVLGGGATPPVGKTTILVIGSDTRPKSSKEPGAETSGYGRSDSLMLLRVGGGHTSKLSIARDTIVPIEGHGVTKINAAYAYGGPALLVKTVEQFTGVNVNHVMQINFASFPDLINAEGGISYKGSCVVSKISGGYKNGGVTLRIPNGKKVHLNGNQALALARTRHNACNKGEDDLTRARRQQRVMSAMKSKALSPIGFVRMPLIAWQAPKTLGSDMGGPRLIATIAGMALSTGGKTHVLGTDSGIVPDAMKQKLVKQFLGD
ncbi:MAG: LCP family protein [Solirubrobacteraceae bacterium]|nr:LCP family protein [Patulibacter sp.]